MPARIRTWMAAVCFLGCGALSPAFAAPQAKAPAAAPPAASAVAPQSSNAGPDEEQEYVFGVQIQEVTVPVTVTDGKGQFITDLDKRDFAIYDNGLPQRIENFQLTQEPLSVAIVAETSSRIQSLLPDVRAAGILITQLILGESGEAALITFDREVKIAQDFTTEADKIEASIKNLKTGPSDQTHLSDAVGRAMFLLQRRPRDHRKVIIVISEARDAGSRNRFGLVLRGAQQLGIPVYTVGLSIIKSLLGNSANQSGPSSPYPPGVVVRPGPASVPPTFENQTNFGAANVNVLEIVSDLVTYAKNIIIGNPLTVFAAGTGGADFATDNRAKVERALSRIGEELRNQYVITYRPNSLDTPGFHTITVSTSRHDAQLRYRPGYVLAPPIQSKPPARGTPPEPLPAAPGNPSGQ